MYVDSLDPSTTPPHLPLPPLLQSFITRNHLRAVRSVGRAAPRRRRTRSRSSRVERRAEPSRAEPIKNVVNGSTGVISSWPTSPSPLHTRVPGTRTAHATCRARAGRHCANYSSSSSSSSREEEEEEVVVVVAVVERDEENGHTSAIRPTRPSRQTMPLPPPPPPPPPLPPLPLTMGH